MNNKEINLMQFIPQAGLEVGHYIMWNQCRGDRCLKFGNGSHRFGMMGT